MANTSASMLAATTASSPETPTGFRQELSLLLAASVCAAFLLPLLVVLLYSSTSQLRRCPVFVLNVFALVIGLAEGIIIVIFMAFALLDTSLAGNLSPRLTTLLLIFVLFVPICVQPILLFRLLAVYPRSLSSKTYRVVICLPTGAAKVARIVTASLFLAHVAAALHHETKYPAVTFPVATVQSAWGYRGYLKAAMLLQLFDDVYMSILLTLRLSAAPSASPSVTSSNRRRLCALPFSTFILPVLLDVAQVALLFVRASDWVVCMYIPLVNTYIQIICVLLATVGDPDFRSHLLAAPNGHSEDMQASIAQPGLATLKSTGAPSYSYFASTVSHTGTVSYLANLPPGADLGSEELSTPSVKGGFTESVRDSNTQVGDDAEERLKWLAELGKEQGQVALQPSIATSVMFDNTGQPPVFYAV